MTAIHLPLDCRIFQMYVWSLSIEWYRKGHAWHGFARSSAAGQQRVVFMLQ
jgi:hypothetical protein